MAVVAPGIKGGGARALNGAGTPRALDLSQSIWYTPGRGVPRYEDLYTIRRFSRSHTVSIPMLAIKGQVTTTEWSVVPTVDKPTSKHFAACDAVVDFLDGGFSRNPATFDTLCKEVLNDILTIDAGVLELVPDSSGWLREIYARDGATFTKNPDEHGLLPEPGSDTPAYYQVGAQASIAQDAFGPGLPRMSTISQMDTPLYRAITPIPFSRDQIVWIEENPSTDRQYGWSRVQMAHRLIEILLNQDISNLKYFPQNEVPEGILNLPGLSNDNLTRFREYWKDEIVGKPHKLALMNSTDATWIPFRASPKELEFLASQEWYNNLVWMCFGVSANEVGYVQDVNRSCYSEDTEVLTENGWKLHPDVAPGERIVVHDPETGECRLEVPGPLHAYYADEELVRFASNGQDILVTQEHTILYRGGKTQNNTPRGPRPKIVPRAWKVAPAKDLVGASRVNVKSGADAWVGEDMEISDDYLRFLGWAISEGGLSSVHRAMGKKRKVRSDRLLGYSVMTLAQSNKNPENVAEIRRVLKAVGAEYREYQDVRDDTTRWNVYGDQLIEPLFDSIGAYCGEKRIPRPYLNLPPDRLRPLFEALMAGDGSWGARENRACGYYSTTSPGLADDIQELAFKLGYGTKRTVHYEGDERRQTCYRILIREDHERTVYRPRLEPYTGFVYCFSTSTGFYVTRRNGRVAVQGNTAQEQAEAVWRRTTVPLLELLAGAINRSILPFLEEYWDVAGEIAFQWDPHNPIIERQKRAEQESDLRLGLSTPNRILVERGEEPVPWGDMPLALVDSLARMHPEWFAREIIGIENAPEPLYGGGLLLSSPDPITKALADIKAAPDDEPEEWRSRIEALHRRVVGVFDDAIQNLRPAIEAVFPAERSEDGTRPIVDLDAILDQIAIADDLLAVTAEPRADALRHGIDLESCRLEEELEARVGKGLYRVHITKDFDVTQTFAYRLLQQRAARNMRSVEDSIKDLIRTSLTRVAEEGGNVNDAWLALQRDVAGMTDDHARLVARTEIMGAQRYGKQVLAEETEHLLKGKTWRSRKIPGRSRPWHSVMDGVTVPVRESWTVPATGAKGQPKDYPKQCYVVGEDQPFNCMCDQRLALADNLPDTVQELRSVKGVNIEPLTKQAAVLLEHGRPHETLQSLLQRLEKDMSKNQMAERLGISKATLYEWLRQE